MWIDEAPEGVTSVTALWTPEGTTDTAYVAILESSSWTAGPVVQEYGDYIVGETPLPDYWTSTYEVSTDGAVYTDIVDGAVTLEAGGELYIRISNDYYKPPQDKYGMVTVHKIFEGEEYLEDFDNTEFTIKYTLYKPNEDVYQMWTDTDMGSEWEGNTATFNGILVGDGYFVEETIFEMTTPIAGSWSSSVSPSSFEVFDGTVTDVYVTNTYTPVEPTNTVDIEKTVNPTSHYTGQGPVTYTITFENTSFETAYQWIGFSDETSWAFDTEMVSNFEAVLTELASPAPITTVMTTDGGDIFGDPIDMTTYGGFEPGDIITITYDYVSSGFGTGTYTNTVTGCAWMGGIDYLIDRAVESNGDINVGISQPVCDTDDASFTVRNRSTPDNDNPGVRIDKSVDVTQASVGDTVTYTIKVTNNGDVSLTDVMVTDDLIDVEWEIGNLSKGDSITETFEYTIQSGDFDDGVFENIAEVTADSREGKASDEDDATVRRDGEEIIIPPATPPATPPDVVVPPSVPPQALPQTGQSGPELFYGIGSLVMAAGYVIGKKKRG